MKLTLQLMTLSSIFSAFFLLGCAGVQRPDADFCGVNFASDKPAHLHCFNVKNDYTSDGILNPGAKAHDKPITSPAMLNGGKFVSKEDWSKTQVWLQDMRNYAKEHCQ